MSRTSVRVLCLVIPVTLFGASRLGAQEKGAQETKAASSVPQADQPPAGLCRVWLENVPAGQQPAPTDCATAIKNRPKNARIVFGAGEVAGKPQLRSAPPASPLRANSWSNRQNDGPGGVRTVNATAPAARSTPDSGHKGRP